MTRTLEGGVSIRVLDLARLSLALGAADGFPLIVVHSKEA